MTRYGHTSNPFWYGFAGLLFLSSTRADLLGCAEIGCPVNSELQSTCQINGSHIPTLGFTNFTTSLTSDPLSWTVGYARGTPNNTANGADERVYYLGTPSNLDLNSVSSVSGCALFFVGVEAGLSFTSPGTPEVYNTNPGTCDDALGVKCVSDLIQQTQNYTNSLNNGAFHCSVLGEMLKNNPPASCSTPGSIASTWGDIIAKGKNNARSTDEKHANFFKIDLTGPETPPKLQLDTCRPTMNQTYDVRIINSTPKIAGYVNRITPLMTVFAPASGLQNGNVSKVASTSEAHLNCMQLVVDEQTKNLVAGGASDNMSRLSMVWLLSGALLSLAIW